MQVVSAAGEHILVISHVSILVNLSDRQIEQPFVVVGALIVLVILGLDYLCKHWLILDFATYPIKILPWPLAADSYEEIQELHPVVEAVMHAKQSFVPPQLQWNSQKRQLTTVPFLHLVSPNVCLMNAHPLVHDFEDLFVLKWANS